MHSRRRSPVRVFPAACLVAAVFVGGCSDSNGDDSATTASSSPLTTTRPVDTSFTGQGSEEFCRLIATFTANNQSLGASGSAEDLEGSLRESLGAIDQAAAVAPAEIKNDVVTLESTLEGVVTALSSAGFDVARVDPAALSGLQSEPFVEAVTRLQAYLSTVCKTPAG
jgi:hypothetical protein